MLGAWYLGANTAGCDLGQIQLVTWLLPAALLLPRWFACLHQRGSSRTLSLPYPWSPCIASLSQDKLFKSYIEMELQLGNIDRCRTLYQKYIEWSPANAAAWGRCAEAWLWEFGCGVSGWEGHDCTGVTRVFAATPARQGDGGRQGRGPMHAAAPPTHLTDPPTHPPFLPHPPTLQCRFADLERSLGESERARAVYELAIAQPVLDMPEVLWKVRRGGAGRGGASSVVQRQCTHAAGRGPPPLACSPVVFGVCLCMVSPQCLEVVQPHWAVLAV